MSNYIIGEQIGQGSFGTISSCRDINTNKCYAVKLFNHGSGDALREISMIKMINHPNCVKYIDHWVDDQGKIYLVMEKCDSNLISYLGKIDIITFERFKTQLLDVILFFIQNGIRHRDLKPGNILVKDGNIKVCDFGSMYFEKFYNVNSKAGRTINYTCPNSLSSMKYKGIKVDLHPLGLILWELLFGSSLLNKINFSENDLDIYSQLMRFDFRNKIIGEIKDENLKNLLLEIHCSNSNDNDLLERIKSLVNIQISGVLCKNDIPLIGNEIIYCLKRVNNLVDSMFPEAEIKEYLLTQNLVKICHNNIKDSFGIIVSDEVLFNECYNLVMTYYNVEYDEKSLNDDFDFDFGDDDISEISVSDKSYNFVKFAILEFLNYNIYQYSCIHSYDIESLTAKKLYRLVAGSLILNKPEKIENMKIDEIKQILRSIDRNISITFSTLFKKSTNR